MNQFKIDLLQELAHNLTPITLATIVADLNSTVSDRLSDNMSAALDIMTTAGEANAGPDEFARMVTEAEDDLMP